MYLCPDCGSNLKFDIPSQTIACDYCHTQMDPYSLEDKSAENFDSQSYEVTVFSCPQCGGEIISTDTSAAEFCTFCGASTILHSRLQNEKRPTYIIPFQKTKEDCKKAYGEFMKKAYFAPDALKDPKHIDGFRGIYIPYWAFEISQNGDYALSGSKTRRSGDYTITDHFKLSGHLEASYKGFSYDASSSFDDHISEKLAPYNVHDLKEFTPAFLSGFYADTADVPPEVYQSDAENLANDIADSHARRESAYIGYTLSGSVSPDEIHTKTERAISTMYPVWFLSYRNAGRVAYATINGQTGKVITDLPIDTRKYVKASLLLALPIFLLLNVFFTLPPVAALLITTVMAVISFIICQSELATISKREDTKAYKRVSGRVSSIAAFVLSILIFIANPINDWIYYGGAIVSLLGILNCFRDIMFYYNIMATRRLPQFDRTGGDDRA